ncbi:uncharacterized protein [Apostichopus japonicus]|uniref:uncharacterized protein isoform X2 n=1 Tax=Stichopus japonicus TaxID=307972 RepID=UPI003AB710A3
MYYSFIFPPRFVAILMTFCWQVPPSMSDCNITISTNGGNITSPNYPDEYGSHVTCWYLVIAPYLTTVTLSFSSFEIEAGSSWFGGRCRYDSLSIHDGMSSSDTTIKTLCGYSVPTPTTSTGNAMFLLFTSDHNLGGRGFLARATFNSIYPEVLPTTSNTQTDIDSRDETTTQQVSTGHDVALIQESSVLSLGEKNGFNLPVQVSIASAGFNVLLITIVAVSCLLTRKRNSVPLATTNLLLLRDRAPLPDPPLSPACKLEYEEPTEARNNGHDRQSDDCDSPTSTSFKCSYFKPDRVISERTNQQLGLVVDLKVQSRLDSENVENRDKCTRKIVADVSRVTVASNPSEMSHHYSQSIDRRITHSDYLQLDDENYNSIERPTTGKCSALDHSSHSIEREISNSVETGITFKETLSHSDEKADHIESVYYEESFYEELS